MGKIESKIGVVKESDETIFNFISDFRNFKSLVDHKVDDFEGNNDWCSFNIPNIGKGKLTLIEKEPNNLIKINGEGAGHNFTLWIQIKNVGEKDSRVKISMEPHVNAALMLMVKGPVKEFTDSLAANFGKIDFSKTA